MPELGTRLDLALSEHVLLWLDHLERRSPETDVRATQPGIAEATGRSRSQVSRVTAELVAEGLVFELPFRPPGFRRSISAYRLAPPGRSRVSDVASRIGSVPVSVTERDGRNAMRSIEEVRRELGENWTLWDALGAVRASGTISLRSPPAVDASSASHYLQDLDDAPPPRPFVGRATELEAFQAWLRSSAPVWTLEAPAGMGKSSLLAHAIRSHRPVRHVLWLRAAEGSGPSVLLERLDRLLRRAGRPGPALTPGNPQENVAQIRPRIAGLPLLVVIDDVHKAEAGLRRTIDALSAVAETEPSLRLVLAGRHIAPPPETARVARARHMGPLPAEDAQALLATLGIPRERYASLLTAAQGNALFLILMARTATAAAPETGIAHYLVHDLGATLSADEHAVLRWACALRLPARRGLFERLEVGSPATFETLVRDGLMVQFPDGRLDMHDVTREAFYEQLSFAERRHIHEALARAFEPRASDWSGMAEFLHHLVKAGRRDEAASWVIRHRNQILARIQEQNAVEPRR